MEAPGGWRCLLTELEPIPTDSEEATRRQLRLEATVGLYTFPIGAAVRVKPSVVEPRHQWGQVRPGSVGRIAGVSSGTAQLLVNFDFLNVRGGFRSRGRGGVHGTNRRKA